MALATKEIKITDTEHIMENVVFEQFKFAGPNHRGTVFFEVSWGTLAHLDQSYLFQEASSTAEHFCTAGCFVLGKVERQIKARVLSEEKWELNGRS